MALYKRAKRYWMDATVNGVRYREPLETSDWRKAQQLERGRISQLEKRAPDPMKRTKTFGALDVESAMTAYIAERQAQVSPRMVAYWKEQAVPLKAYFRERKLKHLNVADICDYQNHRLSQGKAPKTINGEVSALRQLLKHARLWYRFEQDYKSVPKTTRPVGRALTIEEQQRLFEVASLWKPGMPAIIKTGKDGKDYKLHPDGWIYAYTAAILGTYCGMRACEIRGLQWKDVDLVAGLLEIRRSKTPGGWRTPTLNTVCSEALSELYERAKIIGATEPDHYVFPWQGGKTGGQSRKSETPTIDPTRPSKGWRSAWRSILKEAGIKARFHDLRHTAVTTMAEKGLPDLTIMAQVGHVSPEMMKTYSHIRRQALNQAAAALEPNFPAKPSTVELVN